MVLLSAVTAGNIETLEFYSRCFVIPPAAACITLLTVRSKEEGGVMALARRTSTAISTLFCPRRATTQAVRTGRFDVVTSGAYDHKPAVATTASHHAVSMKYL